MLHKLQSGRFFTSSYQKVGIVEYCTELCEKKGFVSAHELFLYWYRYEYRYMYRYM